MKTNPNKRKVYLRVFSVFFSLLIWLYVISSAQVEVEKIIPIELDLPEGYALAAPIKKEVSLFLKGPRVFVRTVLERPAQMKIKLEDYYKPGKKKFTLALNRYQYSLPISVEQTDMVPKKIELLIDKEITKTLPVIPTFDPETLRLYDVEKIKVTPDTVDVTGAKSLLKNITTISTNSIDNKVFDDTKGLTVRLKNPDENIILSEQEVMIDYTLNTKWTEFTFTSIPIIFHSTKLIRTALPKTVNVTLKGDKEIINQLNKQKIQVIAKVEASDQKQQKIDLQTQLPEEVELVRIEPEAVTVVLE